MATSNTRLGETPPNCGQRLVPVVVDEIAKNDPTRTFIAVARGVTAAEGYVDITYNAFARAVNRCAWYLEEQIGRSDADETIFYIGPLDIRYLIIWLAALKTGHIAFFSSHRNSFKAHLSLLEKTGCNVCLEPEKAPSILNQIFDERPMKRVPLANLDSLLEEGDVQEFPFTQPYDQVKDKTSIILHTSGSTGIPKPVNVPHGVFASQDAQQLIPSEGGKSTWVDLVRGQRVFIGLPLFHAACLTQVGVSAFVDGFVVVLPPPGPMNVDVVDGVFTHGNAAGALIAPSLIVDVYKNPEILSNMVQHLTFLAYVGGTVSKAIGDDLSSKLHLITNFGSTETLSPPLEVLEDRKDWEYLSYSPCYGHEMRPVGNGLCELIIVRNPEFARYQGVFSTFPKLQEYSTSDLYEPHPSKENLWRFRMRNDDIICFNNAEKLNPITMEATITGHPKVQSAVIGGHGQFQSCLLLEPKIFPQTQNEAFGLLDEIWPTVKLANNDCPAHGRLMKNFIMLSDPKRPLPRAGKDTVQRAAAFQLYEQEFKAIYDVADGESPLFVSIGKLSDAPVQPAVASTPYINPIAEIAKGLTNGLTNGHAVNGEDSIPAAKVEAFILQYLDQRLPELVQQYVKTSLGTAMSQIASDLFGGSGLPTSNGHTSGVSGVNGVNGSTPNAQPELDVQDKQSYKKVIRHIIGDVTYVGDFTDEANVFECGLDSVQVPELVKAINKTFGDHLTKTGPVVAKVIYDNPSVNQIAQTLHKLVHV